MKTTTILTLCTTAALATSAHAATTIFADDFDALTTGTSLSGQGGWTNQTGPQVVADPGSFGFSGNIVDYAGNDDTVNHAISGLNDTGIMTMSADLRINADISYTYLMLSQSGVSLGVEYGNLTLRGAFGGTQNYDHNLSGGDNIYHMVLTIDPTAYSGAGSGTVTFAAYTAENTLGAAVTAFNNVELNLISSGNALSDNNNLAVRMHNPGSGARIDNISITQVPEPSSAALLGLGGLALILRRRK